MQPDIVEPWKFYTFIAVALALWAISSASVRRRLAFGARVAVWPITHFVIAPTRGLADRWSVTRLIARAYARIFHAGRAFWIRGLIICVAVLIFEFAFARAWSEAIQWAIRGQTGHYRLPLWMQFAGYARPTVEALAMFLWGLLLLRPHRPRDDTAGTYSAARRWLWIPAALPALLCLHLVSELITLIGREAGTLWISAGTHEDLGTKPGALLVYFVLMLASIVACVPALAAPLLLQNRETHPFRRSWSLLTKRWWQTVAVLALGIGVYWIVRVLVIGGVQAITLRFWVAVYVYVRTFTPVWLFLGPLVMSLVLAIAEESELSV